MSANKEINSIINKYQITIR